MPTAWLLMIAAYIEAFTGVALIAVPNLIAPLLLGETLSGAGLAVARLAGVSLLALGIAAGRGRQEHGKSPALAAMLTYNVLAAVYLAFLGIDGHLIGKLLWPVVAIHAVLGLLFIRAWSSPLPGSRAK
jgi:hypothetical protein